MTAEPVGLFAIVPAAGASRRLGQPKQLLVKEGRTLLAACVQSLATVCDDVIVVTGANAAEVRATLPASTTCVHNTHWRAGLGSSLAAAVASLPRGCAAVLIALPDQPLLGRNHFAALAQKWRDNREHIVCAAYADTRGVPAVLPRRLFAALASLPGDRGAAALIADDPQVIAVSMPEAATDVDRPEDVEALGLRSPR